MFNSFLFKILVLTVLQQSQIKFMTNISQNYLLIVQDDSYRKKLFFPQCESLMYRNNYERYNMKTTEYLFIFINVYNISLLWYQARSS